MENNNSDNSIYFKEDTFNIREEVEKYAYYWKWFVLGIFLSILTVYLYLRYTPNQYQVSATILVEGSESSELSAFSELSLLGKSNASLENEIELLTSRNLLRKMVEELDLNVSYFREGRVIEAEFHKSESPIRLNFLSEKSEVAKRGGLFKVLIASDDSFFIEEGTKTNEFAFGEKIDLNFGSLIITPTSQEKLKVGDEIIVKLTPVESVISKYRSKIQIASVKGTRILKLTLADEVKLKAEEIVNNLILQYNEDAIYDKGLVIKNTNDFINERIDVINEDLSSIESGVESFKKENKLIDVGSEAGIALQNSTNLNSQIVELNTQLKLIDFVTVYIQTNENELIPSNLGLLQNPIDQSTSKYNEILLERNRLLKNSSSLNPVIASLEEELTLYRENIHKSLVNLKSSLNISLQDLKSQEAIFNSKIGKVPEKEREFRGIERQQQIVEALYLYLLQKREENAMALAANLPSAKIVDKAYGSNAPIFPKPRMYYLAAIALGLLIPFGIIYLIFLLDNKVHSRKDVEAVVKAPILGDIPKSKEMKKLVVSKNDRTSTAESFRLLRTNINFMLANVETEAKTIFVTSTLGGEGKTFIAINIATVLALSNKKVLLIGGDIRKPRIAEYLGIEVNKGLTHYLMDQKLQVSDIIDKVEEGNFDLVSSGIIAPNPSELLMNGRFEDVLAYGKEHYDYVIVDTAPINIVTDTLLLSKQSDLFIYVIRANFLDKRLLEIPQKLYREKRLSNMAVLLNDTDFKRGYGYGYGYGYSEKESSKKWWQKIVS